MARLFLLIAHQGESRGVCMDIWRAFQRLIDEARRFIPGTRDHKVHRAIVHGRALFYVDGRIQICRMVWEWEDEQEQRGCFYWLPAYNADQLEPDARAYLAREGKELAEGQFIKCPKRLARRARWE